VPRLASATRQLEVPSGDALLVGTLWLPAEEPAAVVLIGLGVGSLLLFPSLYLLYRIFKDERPLQALDKHKE